MSMQMQASPFMQHALQHAQMRMGEFAGVVSLSQNLIPACDNVILSINSGNMQQAIAAAQNCKAMSVQLAQSTQMMNNAIAHRLEMASYVLQNLRNMHAGFTGVAPWQMNVAPYQQTASPYPS
jgi:hypothetical protein